MTYIFTEDYKTDLERYTKELEGSAKATSREERKQAVEGLTDAYIDQTGERPDGSILYRLTNVILHEELTDKSRTKLIKSEHQQRALKGEKKRRNKTDGVVNREVVWEHASNVASDGIDYTLPIRSFKNPF